MSGRPPRRAGLSAAIALAAVLAHVGTASAAPTWLPSFPLGFDAAITAMAPDGTAVFGYTTDVGGFTYRAAVQVRPPGGPLGPVQYLSAQGATNVLGLSIAAGPDGRVVAVWLEGGTLEMATLPSGGSAFGAETPLAIPGATPGEAPIGFTPSVAVDAAGDVLVLVSTQAGGGSTGTVYLRFIVVPGNGGTATSQVVDSHATSTSSMTTLSGSMAASDTGAAVAAWSLTAPTTPPPPPPAPSTTTVDKAALRPAGQPMGTPTTLETSSTGVSSTTTVGTPVVAMNPAGRAAVAWPDISTPTGMGTATYAIRLRAGTSGTGFAAQETPTSAIGTGTSPAQPTLVVGSNGELRVGWLAQVSGAQRAQAVLEPPGAGTYTPAQALVLTDQASGVHLATSPNGSTFALLTGYNSGTGKSSVAASVAGVGASFGAPTAPFASGLSSAGTSVAADAAGDGVVIWRSYNGSAYQSSAVGYDAAGPQLHQFGIPAAGTAGDPLAFTVAPVDVWSTVTTHWDFGDGAGGDGTQVSHAYGSAGDRTVTVTATDAVGNATSAAGPTSIAAAPVIVMPDRTPPTVTGFGESHARFAVRALARAIVAKAKHTVARGTVFHYTPSEPASVTVAIQRVRAGLRKGKRCVAPTGALRKRHAQHCTRFVKAGTLKGAAVPGLNHLPFSGRIGKHALALGSYRAVLHATDAAKNVSRAATLRFAVIKSR